MEMRWASAAIIALRFFRFLRARSDRMGSSIPLRVIAILYTSQKINETNARYSVGPLRSRA